MMKCARQAAWGVFSAWKAATVTFHDPELSRLTLAITPLLSLNATQPLTGQQNFTQLTQLRCHNASAGRPRKTKSSVDAKEAEKFAKLADEWWDPSGPFAPLHRLNSARVKFIRDTVCAMHGLEPQNREVFKGLSVLDVGCGGGILSESMARLGASTHGIDITQENVGVARAHANSDPDICNRIRYDCMPLETLVSQLQQQPQQQQPQQQQQQQQQPQDVEGSMQTSCTNHQTVNDTTETNSSTNEETGQPHNNSTGQASSGCYDVVLASEVIEHVRRPDTFIKALSDVVKPGGTLIISTINRTPASWTVAIVGAEYITRIVPRGTHDWHKFITPQELFLMCDVAGLSIAHAAGMSMTSDGDFQLCKDLGVNYICAFHKPASTYQMRECDNQP